MAILTPDPIEVLKSIQKLREQIDKAKETIARIKATPLPPTIEKAIEEKWNIVEQAGEKEVLGIGYSHADRREDHRSVTALEHALNSVREFEQILIDELAPAAKAFDPREVLYKTPIQVWNAGDALLRGITAVPASIWLRGARIFGKQCAKGFNRASLAWLDFLERLWNGEVEPWQWLDEAINNPGAIFQRWWASFRELFDNRAAEIEEAQRIAQQVYLVVAATVAAASSVMLAEGTKQVIEIRKSRESAVRAKRYKRREGKRYRRRKIAR